MIATRQTEKNAALIPPQEFSQAPHVDQGEPVIELNSSFSVVCKSRSISEASQSVAGRLSTPATSEISASIPAKPMDFVTELFAGTSAFSRVQLVSTALTIIRKSQYAATSTWEAFMLDDSVFLRPPSPEGQWVEDEFKNSVVGLLDLAEEVTECDKIIVALDRSRKDKDQLSRAFMYLGFELIHPDAYQHSGRFLLMGYQM